MYLEDLEDLYELADMLSPGEDDVYDTFMDLVHHTWF